MGLLSTRFMLFHRLVLLPPLVLLTLTCLYTSSTLSPFSSTHRLSFSQDMQCFSCESTSSFQSRSFLSLANFPATSYIRDVVLHHNVLNVEDSRGETTAESGSSRESNEVESFVYGQKSEENSGPDKVVGAPYLDTTRNVREEASLSDAGEEISASIVGPQQVSVEEIPVQQEKGEEEGPAGVEEATNRFPSDEKPAEEIKGDNSVYGDNVDRAEDEIDNSVLSAELEVDNSESSYSTKEISVSGDENVHSSVQVVQASSEKAANFWEESRKDSSLRQNVSVDSSIAPQDLSSESKENLEASQTDQVVISVPEDGNVESPVHAEELHSETKGSSESDLQLENRHLTSDDHDSKDHVETQIETNVSFIESSSPPPPQVEVMRFMHENMSREFEMASIAVQKLMDAITVSGLPTERVSSPNEENLDKNLLLRGGSPQGVPLREERSCEGRHVFVYDLPSKFNVDLVQQCDTLLRWFNFCDYFMNEGMGRNVPTEEVNDKGEKVLVPDGSWFLTHQYALELIFHARLRHYPCLTTDVNQADLFFVPYYAGLDVIRWHFKPNISNDQRDELTVDLMNWLHGQETWSRNNGIDHVFVLGKIGWDFRRSNSTASWGSNLLMLPEMQQPTKVLIERDPWHPNDVGVPHPTFFHPKDDNEFRTWLAHVEQSERRYLVSFAGMPRPKMKSNVRGHLIQQCLDHPDDCFLLRCVSNLCMRPDSTMNLFLHSHFCMQPPGDSPTRRSVFDSLVGGCIPVLFDPYTAYYQYAWHLPQNASSYSVFIPSADVMSGKSDIVEILRGITAEERTAMRTRIIREIIPGLLYSQPGTKHSDFRDAFDISIEALLHRVAHLRAETQPM